jgi:hypothetical protein
MMRRSITIKRQSGIQQNNTEYNNDNNDNNDNNNTAQR